MPGAVGWKRAALASYGDKQAAAYAKLKLAGLRDAPVHLAVFADTRTARGHGLGRKTMPEVLEYFVVGAIQILWLAARAAGLGLGWVSILDPAAATADLDVPDGWRLTAYLCLGWPVEEHIDLELERAQWQARGELGEFLFRR